ncbi:unnamed protein product [Oppiella nova]|uniref:Uncharacterized protein n=1 Tax=Oppiella nova TaxID=334625 RepID=A0A7R9L9F3_9ACAR|nr:unnamed protein product [Oppiella nova]CAG2160668.1 unnamed protein product [Oppiella nova]
MSDNSDTSDKKCAENERQCFCIDLSEVQRDFKRLKVEESDKESPIRSKCDNHMNANTNYFALKSSPYSPKMSCHERRQSMSGLRRQRPHSLSSTKVRHNSHNGLDVKTNASKEDESLRVSQDKSICSDFADLKLNLADKWQQNEKYLYFAKHCSVESNDWRDRFADNKDSKEKKATNSDHNITSKVKANKGRKLRIKEQHKSCARQALCDASVSASHPSSDASVEELSAYFDDTLYLPRKMSFMAESIYS